MQIKEQQSRDSVRVVWNVMPANKTLQLKAGVPQALHYSPLQYNEDSILQKTPPQCSSCHAYMNPYNPIHLDKLHFTCCICRIVNTLPNNYLTNKDQYPPELSLDYSSFLMMKRIREESSTVGYLFVVDIAVSQKELEAEKTALIELVSKLDEQYQVGLISYSKYVYLHDLGSKFSTTLTFTPDANYHTIEVANLMGHSSPYHPRSLHNKFLVSVSKCRETLLQRIRDLKRTVFKNKGNQRQARAVGQALNIALSINELSGNIARVIFFCGGPCTVGLGKVIDQDYSHQMRSIKEETPKMSKQATEFYTNLTMKALSKSVPIHSFIFSVQETGLTEMIKLLTATGGLLAQHEEFDSDVFRQSFRKAFIGGDEESALEMAVESVLAVKCTEEIVLNGLGIRQKERAEDNSSIFILKNTDKNRCFTLYFDLKELSTTAEAFCIQLKTTFIYPENRSVVFERVTTIRRLFGQHLTQVAAGFDQEAALSLLAKLSIQKSLQTSGEELRLWLDNLLLKWASIFGTYVRGNHESFKLFENMRSFPQYIYHLRRHAIIRKGGMSLDEYNFICQIVQRENVNNVLKIIQPALVSYSAENQTTTGVALDEKFMKNQVILLLDSFLNIVQWRGKTIESWVDNNYHKNSQYAYITNLLSKVQSDIDYLKSSRFPAPSYYLTATNHSKQRFIKARLSSRNNEQSEHNLSDEADIFSFMSKLIDLVVNKQT